MKTFEDIEEFLIKSEKRAFVMAIIATKDRDVAVDLVQDAMIKLVSKYENKKSHEWPALFQRILQNRINDWYRHQVVRNRWRKSLDGEESFDGESNNNFNLENYSSIHDQLPEGNVESLSFAESLEIAIAKLPFRQKQVFMLRAWEQYSTKETASIMQCSEGSVKTHYSRALAALKMSLKDYSL